MEYHLERQLRIKTDTEHKSPYSWAIVEVDESGQQVGRDQIPFIHALRFTATSCQLFDEFDFRSRERLGALKAADVTPGPPDVSHQTSISITLRPGYPNDVSEDAQQFSMFGTNRNVQNFQLAIHQTAHPDTQPTQIPFRSTPSEPIRDEECWAGGSISSTSEVEFQSYTDDDGVWFTLHVSRDAFRDYVERIRAGVVDEIFFTVSMANGFYAEWSPTTDQRRIKILTFDHKLIPPPGNQIDPEELKGLQLGVVRRCSLSFRRFLKFGQASP